MSFTPEQKNKGLLYLAGFNLILLNYTLIRQATLAFRDLETSALLTALAYFTGISFGYLKSDFITPPRMRRLLPLFLLFQMGLILWTPLLVYHLKLVSDPTAAYAAIFLLVAVGSTSLYSLFLPQAIQSDLDRTPPYYSAEIIGSLIGLLFLPLLSFGGAVVIYAAYFISFLAIAYFLELRRGTQVLLFFFIAAFLTRFDWLDRNISAAYFKRVYNGRGVGRVIFTRYSPYHKIDVVETRRHQRALLLNNQWQFGPASHENYSYFVAEYPARLLNRPRVALLGCGSMSTVGRMGDYVESIQIVDLDRAVFETSKNFFPEYNRLSELHHWTFIADDAKHFLGTTREKFHLLIDDIPPARTRQVALTYTREFFELVRSRLAPGGIFSLPSLTPIDSNSEYGRRILATLTQVFDQVVVLNDGGSSYFFATDKETVFSREALRAALQHPRKKIITLLLPEEARQLTRQTKVITLNNMADLIRN